MPARIPLAGSGKSRQNKKKFKEEKGK